MDRETAGLMMRQDPEGFLSEFLALQSIIADQSDAIQGLSSELSGKDTIITGQTQTITEQRKEIEDLRQKVAELEELRRLRRAERYKPSTESMERIFPELEAMLMEMDGQEGPSAKEDAAPRTAKPAGKRKRREASSAPAGCDVCDFDHTAGFPASRVINGVTYTLGKELVEKVSVIPSRRVVERHWYPVYTVSAEVARGERRLVVMGSPETDGLACSPSMAAQLIVSKFDDHIPLYRQEEMFLRDGFRLTRQTMASWLGRFGRLLEPLGKALRDAVYSSACLYKDETPVEVLDVRTGSGRIAKDSFMYVTVGSTFSDEEGRFHGIVLVEHIHRRNRENLMSDLVSYGYSGPVITDGLAGYSGIRVHGTCWVHADRSFKKVLKANPKDRDAAEVCRLVGRVFAADKYPRRALLEGKIDREKFMRIRRKASEAAIDDVFAFCDSIMGKYAPSSAMGKAISYLQNHRDTLYTYLGFLEAEPSNNVCERVCKTFAVGRNYVLIPFMCS